MWGGREDIILMFLLISLFCKKPRGLAIKYAPKNIIFGMYLNAKALWFR